MKIAYQNQQVNIVYVNDFKKDVILEKSNKYLVVTDKNVYNYYQDLINYLSDDVIILDPSEESKKLESCNEIIEFLLKNNYSKDDFLVSFGGGVIGDLVGFTASIYKRGMNLINIPTTLISIIDSSIGGKNGVNYLNYKNQIGTIYHPKTIYIYSKFLDTLPNIEYKSGMGEVIKYASLFSKELFEDLELGIFHLDNIIKECINFKVLVTTQDEFDNGLRRTLNFGHTIGHAIEAKYKIPHGIAVGYGMFFESKNERLKQLLIAYGWDFNINFTGLKEYIVQDKKNNNNNNKLKMVILIDIGDYEIKEVMIDELL